MIELIGKIVEVVTADTEYSGKLIEVNETEVHLETEIGWIVVPLERVVDIRRKEVEED